MEHVDVIGVELRLLFFSAKWNALVFTRMVPSPPGRKINGSTPDGRVKICGLMRSVLIREISTLPPIYTDKCDENKFSR